MQARQINALMATSGMYQNAGSLRRVGLPAKSGVGGGIVAIVPHEMAIAVWSPELDDAGNSLAGIAVLEQLTKQLGVQFINAVSRSTLRAFIPFFRSLCLVKERQYCLEKGAPVIEQHAADFVAKRLVRHYRLTTVSKPPHARASGFIAQHATATCCRGCQLSGHNIPQALSEEQQRYIVTVIYHWLVIQMNQP